MMTKKEQREKIVTIGKLNKKSGQNFLSDNENSGDGIRINNIISGISLILVGFTIIIDS